MKRTRVAATALGAAVATLAACATLPDIHYTCDGSPASCPSGWGCGVDGACRAPSGRYASSATRLTVGAVDAIDFADFDGDRRGELVVTSGGWQRLDIDFFDEALATTVHDVRPLGGVPAALGLLTEQAYADLVVPREGNLTVALGRSDHTFGATAYPSILIPVDDTRFTAVRSFAAPDQAGRDLLVLIHGVLPGADPQQPRVSYAMKLTAADRSTDDTGPVPLFATAKPPSLLAGVPAVGQLDTSTTLIGARTVQRAPCEQVVLGYTGERVFHVYSPCRAEVDPTSQEIVAGANTSAGGVASQDPSKKDDGRLTYDDVSVGANPIVEGVRVADMDRDGNLDVLVGIGGASVVAFGKGDGSFDEAVAPPGIPDAFPLSIADLNGDMIPDFVEKSGIRYSTKTGSPRAFNYTLIEDTDAAHPWVDAVIVDANGNGYPDIAAVRGSELVFFNGSPAPLFFTPKTYPLTAPAVSVAAGDLDGDAVPDIAVATADVDPDAAADTEPNDNLVSVAWGRGLAFPDAPDPVGRFGRVLQIGAAPLLDSSAINDLGIVSSFGGGKAGDKGAAIRVAVLPGETSRVLTSPFGFPPGTTVARAAIGAFTGSGHQDVAALASFVQPPTAAELAGRAIGGGGGDDGAKKEPNPTRMKLWVAPSTGDAQLDASSLKVTPGTTNGLSLATEDLAASLDAAVWPNAPTALHWTAADLLGVDLDPAAAKPRDEIVAIVPPTGDGLGALLIGEIGDDGGLSVKTRAALGRGAGRWKGLAVDVDGDGARDVAVLERGSTGSGPVVVLRSRNGSARTLDAAGAITVPLPPGEGAVDVALLGAHEGRAKQLAVLTSHGVYVASFDRAAFSVERVALSSGEPMPGGVAIGAADVDGDGVDDIAIATTTGVALYPGQAGRR